MKKKQIALERVSTMAKARAHWNFPERYKIDWSGAKLGKHSTGNSRSCGTQKAYIRKTFLWLHSWTSEREEQTYKEVIMCLRAVGTNENSEVCSGCDVGIGFPVESVLQHCSGNGGTVQKLVCMCELSLLLAQTVPNNNYYNWYSSSSSSLLSNTYTHTHTRSVQNHRYIRNQQFALNVHSFLLLLDSSQHFLLCPVVRMQIFSFPFALSRATWACSFPKRTQKIVLRSKWNHHHQRRWKSFSKPKTNFVFSLSLCFAAM